MVTELCIRGWKLNISLVFIAQSYLAAPKLFFSFYKFYALFYCEYS